jgi:hypothetical protein
MTTASIASKQQRRAAKFRVRTGTGKRRSLAFNKQATLAGLQENQVRIPSCDSG